MPRVTTAFAAAIALFMPLGRPLPVGLTPAVGIGTALLSTQIAYAQTADDWLDSGNNKYDIGDYQGAIIDYTKAIENNPLSKVAYAYRGHAKYILDNNKEALIDLDKAIELDSDYGFAFFMRALVKSVLYDYQGALADYEKAIEIDPLDEFNYSSRGMVKEKMGDLQGACSDWRKAKELGHDNVGKWIKKQC